MYSGQKPELTLLGRSKVFPSYGEAEATRGTVVHNGVPPAQRGKLERRGRGDDAGVRAPSEMRDNRQVRPRLFAWDFDKNKHRQNIMWPGEGRDSAAIAVAARAVAATCLRGSQSCGPPTAAHRATTPAAGLLQMAIWDEMKDYGVDQNTINQPPLTLLR